MKVGTAHSSRPGNAGNLSIKPRPLPQSTEKKALSSYPPPLSSQVLPKPPMLKAQGSVGRGSSGPSSLRRQPRLPPPSDLADFKSSSLPPPPALPGPGDLTGLENCWYYVPVDLIAKEILQQGKWADGVYTRAQVVGPAHSAATTSVASSNGHCSQPSGMKSWRVQVEVELDDLTIRNCLPVGVFDDKHAMHTTKKLNQSSMVKTRSTPDFFPAKTSDTPSSKRNIKRDMDLSSNLQPLNLDPLFAPLNAELVEKAGRKTRSNSGPLNDQRFGSAKKPQMPPTMKGKKRQRSKDAVGPFPLKSPPNTGARKLPKPSFPNASNKNDLGQCRPFTESGERCNTPLSFSTSVNRSSVISPVLFPPLFTPMPIFAPPSLSPPETGANSPFESPASLTKPIASANLVNGKTGGESSMQNVAVPTFLTTASTDSFLQPLSPLLDRFQTTSPFSNAGCGDSSGSSLLDGLNNSLVDSPFQPPERDSDTGNTMSLDGPRLSRGVPPTSTIRSFTNTLRPAPSTRKEELPAQFNPLTMGSQLSGQGLSQGEGLVAAVSSLSQVQQPASVLVEGTGQQKGKLPFGAPPPTIPPGPLWASPPTTFSLNSSLVRPIAQRTGLGISPPSLAPTNILSPPPTYSQGLSATPATAGIATHQHGLADLFSATKSKSTPYASAFTPGPSKTKSKEVKVKNVSRKFQCQHKTCEKKSTHGYDGQKPRFCTNHALPGMVGLARKECGRSHCENLAWYGFEKGHPQYCKQHKSQGMINVICKRCSRQGCDKVATFSSVTRPGLMFCSVHKQPNMLSKHTKCQSASCLKPRYYGYPGDKVVYCRRHMLPNMINLRKKKPCKHTGCSKCPSYGYPGGKARYCTEHQLPNMINVFLRKCEAPGCKKTASFAYPNNKAQFCKQHKTKTMVNVNRMKHEQKKIFKQMEQRQLTAQSNGLFKEIQSLPPGSTIGNEMQENGTGNRIGDNNVIGVPAVLPELRPQKQGPSQSC